MTSNPPGPEGSGQASSFESALARLEEVVRRLEAGDVPLEEALALFEEGVKLARTCSERLQAAERRIELLVSREDGTFELKPFAGGPDDPPGDRRGGALQ
jgi:exodeoxyribonuclease VII small subunit